MECVAVECVAVECVAVECVAVECVAVERVAVECVAVECVAVERSQWSASQWSGSFEADPQRFSAAQTASLLAISLRTRQRPEFAGVNTWNNTGFIYLRVQGKNGLYDAPTRSR